MIRRLGSMNINMVHCWVFQKSFLLTVLTRFQIGFRNICREAIASLNIGEHPCCIAGDVFIRECKPFPNRDTESWAVGLPLVASGLRPLCLSSSMSLFFVIKHSICSFRLLRHVNAADAPDNTCSNHAALHVIGVPG